MLETLLDKQALWLSGQGPDADIVVSTQCSLCRNLADFPFPPASTQEEKCSVQQRVFDAMEKENLLSTGQWIDIAQLGETEIRFLQERSLLGPMITTPDDAYGVYVEDDQSLSVSVNESDHVTTRGLIAGLQPQELWARMNHIDDTLAGTLDFAFNERIGYLTTSLHKVGTGLTITCVVHLPGLVMGNAMSHTTEWVESERHVLSPLFVGDNESPGDLYTIRNTSTLGRSEDETVFHIKQIVTELVGREHEARKAFQAEAPLQIEDRVGRAFGLAGHARLLAFDETLRVLSSLRLGKSSGLLDQLSYHDLNDTLMVSQDAHIELKCGHSCDELTLSAERADLFRGRFAD